MPQAGNRVSTLVVLFASQNAFIKFSLEIL